LDDAIVDDARIDYGMHTRSFMNELELNVYRICFCKIGRLAFEIKES